MFWTRQGESKGDAMLGKRMDEAAKQAAVQLELSIAAELRKLAEEMQARDRIIDKKLRDLWLKMGEAATTEQIERALELANREVAEHLEAAESAAQKANAAAARAHRGLQKHAEEAEEVELAGQSSNIEDGPYPHARHPKLG